jgi:outer membrane protein assembly factor BamE (lipoprotein component of BamABCDE complex)
MAARFQTLRLLLASVATLCIFVLASCTTMDANPTYNAPVAKGDSKSSVRKKMGRPNFRSVTDGKETWVYRGSNTSAMTLQTAGFAAIPMVGGALALGNAFSKPHQISMVTLTFNSSGRVSKISRSFYETNARL